MYLFGSAGRPLAAVLDHVGRKRGSVEVHSMVGQNLGMYDQEALCVVCDKERDTTKRCDRAQRCSRHGKAQNTAKEKLPGSRGMQTRGEILDSEDEGVLEQLVRDLADEHVWGEVVLW
jgi:hypothetical protein